MATGAQLVGVWSFNGNGSTGWMTISSAVDDGPVSLAVRFDGLERQDTWVGNWSPGERKIVLVRQLPGGAVQEHVGHLGDNNPDALIFGGGFTESDTGPLQFGWFAQWTGEVVP